MDKNQFIAQILEQIPDCPHSRASAYLLEFTRRLRNHGAKEITRRLTRWSNDGYVAHLDDNVRTVSGVYVNGLPAGDTMTEAEAVQVLYLHPGTTSVTAILTELGDALTDELGNTIEIEAI
jgi:hypothetical protein